MIDVEYNTKAVSARFRQRSQQMTRAILKAETMNARELKDAARTLSSGPYTSLQLRRMRKQNSGHGPYSTASPNPPAPPFIINKQSKGFGSISQMWQTRLTTTVDGTQLTLFNTSPHAFMAFGTRYAIPRPILQAVANGTHQNRRDRLASLKSKVLRL